VNKAGNDSYPPEEPGPGKLCSTGSEEASGASEGHW